METMKAIIKAVPGPGASLANVEVPKVGPKEVLVKIKAIGICGTDVHIYTWDEWASHRIKPPRIFGHEFVGEVVEVGKDVTLVKPGDYVSAETHIACGKCYYCRTGNAHICENVKILGVDVDGAYAEYIAIPEENAWKTDRSIPPEVAAIQEPFGNAVHATLIEDITAKSVAVFGLGPIGLMSVAIAKAAGASKIFAVEPSDYRRSFAEKMGADFVINPNETDPISYILDHTSGLGVDVVLEMSGSEAALKAGLRVLKKGGVASLLGIPSKPVTIDITENVIFKYLRLYGINGRLMFRTWYQVQELLASKRVDLTPIITHRMKLEQFDEAMKLLIDKQAVKIVLYPE
ncbi:MAG: L-threonine 3-dehydrogenase [Candidatus Hydrothermota bacterium]|nr:MAG: L-threonine 3-dehydrogenase [Candidatus Hydrothermae bacterium]